MSTEIGKYGNYDEACAADCERDNAAYVSWYILETYARERMSEKLISDVRYERVHKALVQNWSEYSKLHQHSHLLTLIMYQPTNPVLKLKHHVPDSIREMCEMLIAHRNKRKAGMEADLVKMFGAKDAV